MSVSMRDVAAGRYDGAALTPQYDRERVTAGIVHIGVGNFHRSHQALYVDELLATGTADGWGICGVGVLPSDRRMRDVLAEQDGLYTLLTKSPDGSVAARIIASITEYLWVPEDPRAVLEKLADPRTRIVTLTVTESGYNIDPATGDFRTEDAAIRADLAGDAAPRTHFRLLHESLRLRRDRGIPPYTVLSCDNVHRNGAVARRTLLDYIALADPEFGEWVDSAVSFPNSMVDRITPVTVDEDRVRAAEDFGLQDAWPVPAESFAQWVIEDRFPTGRPPLERVGVQLVDDVVPYELMKMRLLNASHQVIGLFSLLRGHEYVHEAMGDPLIRGVVARFQEREAEPTLTPIPGVDFAEYRRTLLERFANPGVRDTIARLSSHSSHSIPNFIVPILRDQLAAGRPIAVQAALIAAWAVRAEGKGGWAVSDEPPIVELARSGDPAAFARNEDVFAELTADERFVGEVVHWRAVISEQGIEHALERLTAP